jgi:hypothetical protein
MMKARLLSTVAATLLLTVGVAAAQTMNKDEAAPARAPAAQQNAPAEKVAPTMKPGEQKASTKKGPETIGQAAPNAAESDKNQMKKSQTMDKASPAGPAVKGSSDANGGPNKSKSTNSTAESAPGAATPSAKSADESKKSTTGQGAAAVSAKLSTEQRSKITTIIRSHKVEPAKLNVTVSVGTRVPDSVHFYPLPAEVFVVYPEWRGYDYILVGDEILVIDPRTHEIVAILEA